MNGEPLRVVSCQAPNGEFVYREMAAFIERETGLSTRYVDDVPWQRRYEMLASGEAGIGFVCGLPYVRQADGPDAAYRPIAAPVMAAERYDGRPVYRSDVVVTGGDDERAARHFGPGVAKNACEPDGYLFETPQAARRLGQARLPDTGTFHHLGVHRGDAADRSSQF